ncbi:hypothetical protein BG011_010092 [Mortierella polycephala]|uniref:Cas12f1-like TNB domain-containing protein n=1 Tax=Mortierella polycephala TaxID=41804 RepID=A0A9P6QCB7_9FUNG|nr:hypothetical protein BG011_010092 [Mortierella polycephala]
MRKVDLVRVMQYKHPSETLDIGTVSANVKKALKDQPNLVPEVERCLQEAVHLANDLVNSPLVDFIEHIATPGMVEKSGREMLDLICPRVTNTNCDEVEEEEEDGSRTKNQVSLLQDCSQRLAIMFYEVPLEQMDFVQLSAFKLKELQSVRYRRLPETVLPPKITSTAGGVDYFLVEIRNVVKTKQDAGDLWGCEPEQIKILGLDLGQACILGASVLLPRHARLEGVKNVTMNEPVGQDSQMKVDVPCTKDKDGDVPIGEPCNAIVPTSAPAPVKAIYHNLAVKQKAKHKWDAQRAKDDEFRPIADHLLKLVGGLIGLKRDEANKVVIGAGLGKFSTKTRLSSLHESFQSYLAQKTRSLGYIAAGVNEYYTSKKCPMCEQFVGQVEIRRLYCPTCNYSMHRDVMAGHNICNAVRSHPVDQQRPLYIFNRSIWMGITLGCKMQGHTQKPKVAPAAVLTAIALWDKDKDETKGELVGASEPPPWRLTRLE